MTLHYDFAKISCYCAGCLLVTIAFELIWLLSALYFLDVFTSSYASSTGVIVSVCAHDAVVSMANMIKGEKLSLYQTIKITLMNKALAVSWGLFCDFWLIPMGYGCISCPSALPYLACIFYSLLA